MLTGQLVRPTYRLISIYSRLNFIPVKVNPRNGRATASQAKLKRCSWYFNYTCLLLLVGFLSWRLLQSLINTELFNPVHFPIHFIATSFLTLSVYGMYVLFYASPLSTIQVYNEVVDHLQLGMFLPIFFRVALIFGCFLCRVAKEVKRRHPRSTLAHVPLSSDIQRCQRHVNMRHRSSKNAIFLCCLEPTVPNTNNSCSEYYYRVHHPQCGLCRNVIRRVRASCFLPGLLAST